MLQDSRLATLEDVPAGSVAVPNFEEFERLVDAHVTPHMTKLGYARIGAYCGESSTAYLVPQGRGIVGWVRRRFGHAVSRHGPVEYTMGYEALSDMAAERVWPGDPQTGEEVWLHLDTESGAIDFALEYGPRNLFERYGTGQDREVVRNPGRPLADRLRVLDTLLARFVAAT
jgi:hypothetical protein